MRRQEGVLYTKLPSLYKDKKTWWLQLAEEGAAQRCIEQT